MFGVYSLTIVLARALLCVFQNAYDMLEARRKIAREVTRIKRYKSDKAA